MPTLGRMQIPELVHSQRGVVSVATLHRLGVTESEMRWATRTGMLGRIRYGWLKTADADPAVVRAVRAGGRLGCVSATEHYGLWVPENHDLHVSLPRHAGRHASADVVAHWEGARWRDLESPIDPVDTVIRHVIECCDRDTAIAIVDSALHNRSISVRGLRGIVATMPEKYRSLVDETDARSESGYESVCRARCVRRGFRIRTQVGIPGVGRVDMLIGDRLIVEVDGREWHDDSDAYLADRARDLAAHLQGYVTVRLAPHHIVHEWAWAEHVLTAMVARGEHEWTARQRRFRANNGFGG
jgi:very-short-patch-repair endonuclease